jgi:hypothetical protein
MVIFNVFAKSYVLMTGPGWAEKGLRVRIDAFATPL